MKVSKTLPQNSIEKATNDHAKEISKELFVSPEQRQETYWGSVINITV